MPISAMIISTAMIFYTLAIWREHFAGQLNMNHLFLFWTGLVFDSTGTGMMIHNSTSQYLGLHSLTGYVGIVLMFIHTVWASIVLAKKNESALKGFHKFSLSVWIIWMFSFLNGVYLGMIH